MSNITRAGCNPFEAASLQARESAKKAYECSCKYNGDSASKNWSYQSFTDGALAAAKARAETFTFPVRVCEVDGTYISYASCFAMYDNQTGILATSRHVADVQHSTPRESQVLVRINGQWLPGKVLCPDMLPESLVRECNLAIIKLDGDCKAPAGISLGPVRGTWQAVIAGFSNAKTKAAKFQTAEGSRHVLNMHEFGVTAPFKKSWTGGPVLDTFGHVVGVITGTRGGMTLATTANTLIFYSMALGLMKIPAYPGGFGLSGEDVVYL